MGQLSVWHLQEQKSVLLECLWWACGDLDGSLAGPWVIMGVLVDLWGLLGGSSGGSQGSVGSSWGSLGRSAPWEGPWGQGMFGRPWGALGRPCEVDGVALAIWESTQHI